MAYRWIMVASILLASVLETGGLTTAESRKYICKTFGSGVVQPFNGTGYYVRSNCPFTFMRFTHNRVECDITTQRGDNGLLVHVEIIINKIRTVLQNRSVQVEMQSVDLPYDHTYQQIFPYGTYTKLRSMVLPLSVVWNTVPGGIDRLWVELEQPLSTDITGLCGNPLTVTDNIEQLISDSVLPEEKCQIRDPVSTINTACRMFFSYTLDCLTYTTPIYIKLCEKNIYSYEQSKYISCAFFKEIVQQCGNTSYVWNIWRSVSKCGAPTCAGDLVYVDQGAPFVPSCNIPDPDRFSSHELVSSCVCPAGLVLNDHEEGSHCVSASSCQCLFADSLYKPGDIRSTKREKCLCSGGKWECSNQPIPPLCVMEGQFVTTFDGKEYAVGGKCKYVAAQGLNWIIKLEYSENALSIMSALLEIFQDTYTFSNNMVKFKDKDVNELHTSEHALVFWQSSMYVQVYTTLGLKIQIQMSPEIQIYISPPTNNSDTISGLCGNYNGNTADDFTTSSGIIESSAQLFTQSWSLGSCQNSDPPSCIRTDNEIFADEKCSLLTNPNGIFAGCHGYIPTDHYHMACIQRTCSCVTHLQQCLCAALASYVKVCTSLGVEVGDWRKVTNCTVGCQGNQEFSYNRVACNSTCRSLSGPDLLCQADNTPVEGCGCPEGTHLNLDHTCSPKAQCECHYNGGTTPPGPAIIDGQQCICEDGQLKCSENCGCTDGKFCVNCLEYPVNTLQKTCDSLSKPLCSCETCESGCYCPLYQYEDHNGDCVPLENCTCLFSGKVFSAGESVRSQCKTCVCSQGQWQCVDEPCSGKCQVYGNGHYQTFDSKWFRFDGHCQYTLVEDDCGFRNGTFSVRVESVPCCEEVLTCSRSIILDLKGHITLTLSDMTVTKHIHSDRSLQDSPLYTIHTVGLYIVISVPSKGITLIWDKHTWITIELLPHWRNQVCGLCGNFDSNEMNDLQMKDSTGKQSMSPMAFGNSWKTATPPCSDVTTEMFPCERNSYCAAWAQRRCLIIKGDTFKDCHLKVDPEDYYQACVQESCSCEFEGRFLGFCTAVAAYAEACSDWDVCVHWRTPDLCPVYCDYYNEEGQCVWHYQACGQLLTCGKEDYFTHKLEGCYPRCPEDQPFYDENTGKCTALRHCTCSFYDTVVDPGAVVMIQSDECHCENGTIKCPPPPAPPTTPPAPTTVAPSTSVSTTTQTSTTSTSQTVEPTTYRTTSTSPTITTTPVTPPSTSTGIGPTSVWTTTNGSTTYASTTVVPTTSVSTTTQTSTTSTSQTVEPTTYRTASTTPTTNETPTHSTTTKTTTPVTSVSTSTEIGSSRPPTTSSVWTTTNGSTTYASTTVVPTTSVSTTTQTSTTSTSRTVEATTYRTASNSPTITTTPVTSTSATTEIGSTSVWTTTNGSTTYASTKVVPTTSVSTTIQTPTTSTSRTVEPTTYRTASTSPTITTTPVISASTTTTFGSSRPPSTSTAMSTTTNRSHTTPETTLATTAVTPPSSTTAPTTFLTSSTTPSAPSSSKPTSTSEGTSTVGPSTELSTSTPNWSTTLSPSSTPPTKSTSTTNWSTTSTTTPTTTSESSTTMFSRPSPTTPTWTTTHTTNATTLSTSASTTEVTETTPETTMLTEKTTSACECVDLKSKEKWRCGETWTEDCFHKTCINKKLQFTPVQCPESFVPDCPRGKAIQVSDGCCETWTCDCQCELYGDPHYISFQGVQFDFFNECTYILVEEQSPRHNLTIAVDNFFCVPGLNGSCVRGIIIKYQDNTASLSIIESSFSVQASLNQEIIRPPFEDHGMKFETTGFITTLYIPEIRSYVSLSPFFTLEISLAMENFVNNTQGQCGVCGGGSCVRRDGRVEDDSCCEKTAYDWLYPDPQNPACASAPKDTPCHPPDPTEPPPPPCPNSPLCELLHHPVFAECIKVIDLNQTKKNCEFDSCRDLPVGCSSIEQAAKECLNAGFCIEWRGLTNGSCDVRCNKGLVYRECSFKMDDYCSGGVEYTGDPLENYSPGCFCPRGQLKAGRHSDTCVQNCSFCKGPLGEPKAPGEVWQSNCNLCRCDNRTLTEECTQMHPGIPPVCEPHEVLVNLTCCGKHACVEKDCSYSGKIYKLGDQWSDPAVPCTSFICSSEGIQNETQVCPPQNCPEEHRIWDDRLCCFTCAQRCVPMMTRLNATVGQCSSVLEIPVCEGHCKSQHRVVDYGDLQVEQSSRCCQEKSSELRAVTLQCSNHSTRNHTYRHITSCECTACGNQPID